MRYLILIFLSVVISGCAGRVAERNTASTDAVRNYSYECYNGSIVKKTEDDSNVIREEVRDAFGSYRQCNGSTKISVMTTASYKQKQYNDIQIKTF